MGFSSILDILGSTVLGGIILLTLLRLNGTVIENKAIFGSDRSLQRSLSETAIVVEEDLRRIGYCEDPYKLTDEMSRIIQADEELISFYTDTNRDGNLDSVTFYLSDEAALSMTKNPRDRILYRRINSNLPLIINTNIVEFKFTYYDALGNELTKPVVSPATITHLEISFKVEDPEAYDEKYSEAYWQQVRLTSRNLRKR